MQNERPITTRPGTLLRAICLGLLVVVAAEAKTIQVFPISGESLEPRDLNTVSRLFRDAVEARTQGDSVSLTAAACGDRDCALGAARAGGTDSSGDLIFSTFYKLGSKWIFSATILRADGTGSFSQRLTAASLEDMEAVTIRMADALIQRKTTEQVATIDNLTEKEQDKEPERRRSLYKGGVAVGYLFPLGNSFSYNTVNYLDETSYHDYAQMIRLTWLNTWEFRNNLQLGTDIVWSIPGEIGADASLRYIFGRGDISPFIGGGLGLHYIKGDEGQPDGGRNSGPTLNAQTGLMLFRTYDVNVMVRAQYQVTFNTDVDQGVAADVGVSFGSKGGGNATGATQTEGWSTWDSVGAGALIIFLIALLNQ